jgi:hypothetical protein
MDDLALYATILGIASAWEVARLELADAAKAVSHIDSSNTFRTR